MEQTDTSSYKCVVATKIGPVKARFNGNIQVVDASPPHSYSLEVSAQAGAAGFGSGRADVRLQDCETGTLLVYEVNGAVGGKLAQIGARLIQAFSRKMARTFFENFCQQWAG